MKNPGTAKSVCIWGIIGAVLSVCFLYISFIYSIHGGLGLAGIFFPFAVIYNPKNVTNVFIIVALLQWPIYGIIIAVGREKKMIIWSIVVLLHLLAVIIAEHRVSSIDYLKL
jgi:hypothetical protein